MEVNDTIRPVSGGTIVSAAREALRTRPSVRVTAIVAVAAVVWGAIAATVSSPWIFADELIYSDLAKSLAAGGMPAVRGVTSYSYGLGYPLVLAPAWALAHDLEHAYLIARIVNAVVMSLAAVPIFLLARRVVTTRSAFAVATLGVCLPSMVYTSTLMTEVAFYPVMLFALLAIQRALEEPTWRRQAVALAVIGLAAATKVLALALVPAYLVAALLLAGSGSRWRAWLRSTWVTLGTCLLGLAAFAAYRGGSPLALFGAYAGAVKHVHPQDLPLSMARHVAALGLYTAAIPVVATTLVVVSGLRRGADPALRRFAALAGPTIVAVVGGVAVFAVYASSIDYATTGVPPAVSVYERNVFVLVPLLLIGLAAWVERGMPRPKRFALAAEAAIVVFVLVYPWSDLPVAANPQNLASFPWIILPVSTTVLAPIAAVAVALVLWAAARPGERRGQRCTAIVTGWLVMVALVSAVVFHGAAGVARDEGVGADPQWIDHAVGDGARVTVVWSEPAGRRYAKPRGRQRVVWASEFFNRSVVEVDELGARLPFGLASRHARLRDGIVVDDSGTPVRHTWVVALCSTGIAAPAVAVDRRLKAAVYRTDGVVRLGGPKSCAR